MAKAEEIFTELINKVAAEENIEYPNIKVQTIPSQGANYTSSLYTAVISAPDRADLKLFGKVALLPENVRKMMQADRLYETERFIYNDLAVKYDELQVKNGIPEEDRFKFPKFYACNSNHSEETIVLEDLISQGYTMFDRFKPINWEYASKGVGELAKFHALSFAYKEEYPDEFKKNYDKLAMVTKPPDASESVWMSMLTAANAAIPENQWERLKNFTVQQMNDEFFHKFYGPGKREVIIHGDYRNSNIFFKRQGGKVKSLVPVDYQTVRLGSPVLDLLYFIYSGTDGAFRKLHLKQLLDHYYGAFSRFLRQLNLDPDKHFSRADFNEDYKDHLPIGLSTAIFLLPIVLVDLENAPDVTNENTDIKDFSVKPNIVFNKRFYDVFQDFVKLGIV